MTTTLDTPIELADEPNPCPNPEKRVFDTQIDALAFAAQYDLRHGTDTHPYECGCGKWHNTSTPHQQTRPLKTSSARIDLVAKTFPEAPLTPSPDLEVGFCILTPKIAAYWLTAHNTHNRNVRSRGVSALSVDILAGGWDLNGDTIRFSTSGVMIDGQHRCEAVARAGVPVPIILVTGLEPHAQDSVDTGIRRRFADWLKLTGEHDTALLSAVTTNVCRWKAGQIRHNSSNLSINVLKRVWHDHGDEIREAARTGRRVSKNLGGIPGSTAALASWLFRQIDAEDHDDFFDKLVTGAGIDTEHPVWVLREVLRRNDRDKRKIPGLDLLAYLVKTWNHYRVGTTVRNLSWRSGGKGAEAFPIPR